MEVIVIKFDLHTQRYVDWKVYNVPPIKNKYGFRVKLIYADGTSTIQQKNGYTKKDRNMRRTDEEESMINTIRSLMAIMCAVPPMENQEVKIFIGYTSKNC